MQNAFRYNKISIVERCMNRNIRYVGEYQLKCKQTTKEYNKLIYIIWLADIPGSRGSSTNIAYEYCKPEASRDPTRGYSSFINTMIKCY